MKENWIGRDREDIDHQIASKEHPNKSDYYKTKDTWSDDLGGAFHTD